MDTDGWDMARHDAIWQAGEQYTGPISLLRGVAKRVEARYGSGLAGQTYYDAAICQRLAVALDAGDIMAEAEVRCYAFCFGQVG